MSGLSEKNWDSCWPAPAKLNLFLHVVGRRADGYHLLQTLFRFIDYGDELRFSPRPDGRIVLATPLPGVAPDDDLTVRAARLLQQATGCRNGANIHLDKRLPMGAGLGGGSSDAATTLLALNHLWNLDLNRQTLQTLGLKLGADVPVFVFGRNALAGGIGEALRAVDLPPAWYVLIEPPVHVPTAAIFGDAALRRDTSPIDLARWHHGQTLPGHEPEHNDLEAVAVARYPLIGEAIRALSAHAPARMSGSGASVFAELADEKAARAIAAALSETWQGKWPVRAVQGLAQHPLRTI